MGQSLYKKLVLITNNVKTLAFIAGCVTSINMTQTTDNVYHMQVKSKTQQLHALSNLVSFDSENKCTKQSIHFAQITK